MARLEVSQVGVTAVVPAGMNSRANRQLTSIGKSVVRAAARPSGSVHVHYDFSPLAAALRRPIGASPAADRAKVEVYSPAPMTAALVAGLLAGYGVAMPVGAIGAYLVALTARTSLRIGACAALGVATADGLYALLATFCGSVLARTIKPIAGPLQWASALVLLTLSVQVCATAIRRHRAPGSVAPVDVDTAAHSPMRTYLKLLALTAANPLTVVYFSALVLGREGSAPSTSGEQWVFVVAAFAASASWQLLLAGSGALLGRALTGRRGRLATALVSSALIAALAVRLIFRT